MEDLLPLAIFILAVGGLIGFISLVRRFANPDPEAADPPGQPTRGNPAELLDLASRLYGFFNAGGRPSDLLDNQDFGVGVLYLNTREYTTDDLLGYYTGENDVLACMALEALSRRDDQRDLRDEILESVNRLASWTRFFALRCLSLRTAADRPLVGPVLATIDVSWLEPNIFAILRDFVAGRLAAGEKPGLGERLEEMDDEKAQQLLKILPRLGDLGGLAEEVERWQTRRIDLPFLRGVGRVWDPGAAQDAPIEHQRLLAQVIAIEEAVARAPRRSTLLVGESGVGKTAIIRVLGRRLQSQGWTVFEAGHAELLAGMIYIGQFEDRLRTVVSHVGGGRRVLWVVPDFHTLVLAGRHQYGPASALDFLVPYIESGEITILGETTPTAYEKQIRTKPKCRTVLEVLRVDPLPEDETLDVARQWAARQRGEGAPDPIDEATLMEAWSLVRQYQWSRATPGNLIDFLSLTRRRLLSAEGTAAVRMTVDDLILTLSQLTGLPESLLDDRQRFDLDGLRGLFQQRVMGQAEAVDCLVERVAMMKAGVTDPTRPQGVFLFAGPTGTGKTEIAKTLAEFLFGSSERMIRLDMSEFQEPASLDRILGDAQEPRGDALVELIRKHPFSVVLLDEFEKAHSNIWDLFLQVFDDGRLTDRWGSTADFRHAIIIMTSNLGGVLPGGASLGFTEGSEKFSGQKVQIAVQKAFRKELLNRIDRIVVFRPLGRDVMRAILDRELDAVFKRRGLRNRSWAVEWDDSSIEFLLQKGFTADLGARPLKRAIERYLLAPLATTIVNHQFPEGDQFLFVRGRPGDLVVEFVDPDAPEPAARPAEEPGPPVPDGMNVVSVLLGPQGTRDEIDLLRREYDRLREIVEDETFRGKKLSALSMTSTPGFWQNPDRFRILGQAEYLDRIETGVRTARSLVDRLTGLGGRPGGSIPRHLVGRLAQQLYLIGLACEDTDGASEAFVLVEAGHGAGASGRSSNAFAHRLGRMYSRWAEKRGMSLEVLEESDRDDRHYRLLLSVSGYAARAILSPEEGLHVFEEPESEGRAQKRAARVRVAPRTGLSPEEGAGELLRQARQSFDSSPSETLRIVRRYRDKPSPLVRDAVRGWRTGHLERVLDGDFDIIAGRKPTGQPAEP